jgi:hypothetical protein
MRIVFAVLYLGVGAMLHALFVSAQFDFHSAWTWGWLLAWPFMLGFWFIVAGLVVGAIVLAWEAIT